MSLLQINPAVPLAEPLLEQQHAETKNTDDKNASNNDENLTKTELRSRIRFVVVGVITGFFIQVVSLGAYICLVFRYNWMPQFLDNPWRSSGGVLSMDGFVEHAGAGANSMQNGDPTTTDDHHSDETAFFGKDPLLYTILSVLTQLDLIVYVVVWIAFTCTFTRNGLSCIRSQFFARPSSSSSSSSSSSVVGRRYVFVLGVCFLVGIVLGAFGAWAAIDMYLGFPIPFKPIVITVAIDLVLCYLMVWCFDMGGQKRRRNERRSNLHNNTNNNEELLEAGSKGEIVDDDESDCASEDGPDVCC